MATKKRQKGVCTRIKNCFIPQKDNDYIPRVLKHDLLLSYSIALVLLKVLVVSVSLILSSTVVLSSAINQKNIVDLTNKTRREQGLAQLKINPLLTSAAQTKAEDILTKQYFAHTSPSGTTPWILIRQTGYNYSIAGENLAVHFTTAEGALAGWIANPSHRANIVNKKFSEIGIGVAEGIFEGYPSIIVVQMFGHPLIAKKSTGSATGKSAVPIASKMIADAELSAGQDEAPVILTSSAQIIPKGNGYDIALKIENASSAVAVFGEVKADLQSSPDNNTWRASLAVDPHEVSSNGETLDIKAQNAASLTSQESLAVIAPKSTIERLYSLSSPSQEPDTRLFGVISLDHLPQSSKQFYLLVVIFLSLCLLVTILVKVRIQRPAIIVHALVVIGISATLFRF